jgi:microcystin-dependent protein
MLFYSSSIPAGWALCNGQTVTRIDGGGTITTPNLIGQFVYGGSTAGTTGGSATQTLSVAQLPAHNHAVSDSGHSHTLSDSGHTHTAADSGHTHTDSGHTHTDSGHTHNISSLPDQWSASGAGPVTFFSGSKYGPAGPYSTNNSSANLTTNSANIQSAKAQISVTSATTGITLANATTGITTQNTGSGSAFSIMPPYIVLCYIMKY